MKRKLMFFAVIAALLTLLTLCLVSCGDECEDGHTFGDFTETKAPTCVEKGERSAVCSVCGEKSTEDIPPRGHDPQLTETVNATCTSQGKTVRVCSVCGEVSETAVPMLPHDMIKASSHRDSCTVSFSYCKVCGVRAETPSGDHAALEVGQECGACGYKLERYSYGSDRVMSHTESGSLILEVCSSVAMKPEIENTDELTAIYFSAEVEEIEDGAYRQDQTHPAYTEVRAICFAENSALTHIGSLAFDGMKALTFIKLPETVTLLEGGAFRGCTMLSGAILPDGITVLNGNTFYGCTSLMNLRLPCGLVSMGNGEFTDCVYLESIELPASLIYIGQGAFDGCAAVTDQADKPETVIGHIFYKYNGVMPSGSVYSIPSGVTVISPNAFKDQTGLTELSLKGVSHILPSAFLGCTSLRSFTDAEDVELVWVNNFNIPYFNSEANYKNGILSLGGFLYSSKSDISGDIVIDANIKTVGQGAFHGRTGLTGVSFAEGSRLISIQTSAFSGCTNLERVTLPEGLVSITASAFKSCGSLGSVNIPSSVTTVGDSAFEGCNTLTSVTFAKGSRLITVGKNAFKNCGMLQSIELPASLEHIYPGAFTHIASVRFGDPSGWVLTYMGGAISDELDLSDPEANAAMFVKYSICDFEKIIK